MQQRKVGLGRPSGTDGSDYSYRMVVDSRYQLGAKGKRLLSRLFIIQVLLLLMGVIFAVLPAMKKDTPNRVALYSALVSFISLAIAEIGRRRSRASLLIFYSVITSLAVVLLTQSLVEEYSLLKDLGLKGTRKLDAYNFPGFGVGLRVYIFSLTLFRFVIIKIVTSLLYNMS